VSETWLFVTGHSFPACWTSLSLNCNSTHIVSWTKELNQLTSTSLRTQGDLRGIMVKLPALCLWGCEFKSKSWRLVYKYIFGDPWGSSLELRSYMSWAMLSADCWEKPSTHGTTRSAMKVDFLTFNILTNIMNTKICFSHTHTLIYRYEKDVYMTWCWLYILKSVNVLYAYCICVN